MSALLLDRAVFLHVPKCGGTWGLSALRSSGLVVATINSSDGSTHPPLATVRAVTSLPTIATVRDPVSWLRSFWRFFYGRDWRPGSDKQAFFEPLLSMATPSFAEFANRYLHRRPGYVSELLAAFVDGADAVCRQEHLLSDLCLAFDRLGQPYVREAIERTPRENVSRRFEAEVPKATEEKIREADAWLVAACQRAGGSRPLRAARA